MSFESKLRLSLRSLLLCIPALLALTAFATAQIPDVRTVKVLDIRVEGNTYVESPTVIAIAGLQRGMEIIVTKDLVPTSRTQDVLRNAIKSLWARKQFSDVHVSISRMTDAGAFLLIEVQEYPRLQDIVISGNDDLSDRDIREAIDLYRGELLTPYGAQRAANRVLELYREDGKPFTSVQHEIREADTADYRDLYITIDEGGDFWVRSIKVEGNQFFEADDLIDQFDETKTTSWIEFWASDEFNQELYETDKKLIEKYFQSEGFLDGVVTGDEVLFDTANEAVDITVFVEEGQQYFVRNVEFDGNITFPDVILQSRLRVDSGDVADWVKIQANCLANEDQTEISGLYMDRGFLAVRVEPSYAKVFGTDSIDVKVRISENNQFKVRKVEIVGNTKTYDKVIRRELFTRPGDFFNRAALIRSIRALGVLNYFNPEKLQPDVKPVSEDEVDVVFAVEEKSSDTFNASVGFQGSAGVVGSIGITLNNFSLAEPLTGGAGQVLNFNWQFGGNNSYQEFLLNFTEPWLFDEPTTVGFNLFDQQIRYTYDVRRTGISANIGRRFRWPDDYFRGDWRVQYQRINNKDESPNYVTGVSQEVSLRQTFSRVSLDNAIFPTDGTRLALSTQFAGGSVGLGNVDYLKNELTLDMYSPISRFGESNSLVLYLSSFMGYVTGIEDDTTIPVYEWYHMGGNGFGQAYLTPLRGYPDDAIGPRGANGQILGGKVISRYVAELRFSVAMNPIPIYLLGFAEAGNVWGGLSQFDPFDLKRSAGAGIRIMLNPIGLIGFDYGFGFDNVLDRGASNGWEFHFQFGR